MALPEKYTEIEQALDEPLAQLITARRANGVAWRRIALEITNRTGIDVTGETLRIWHHGKTSVTGSAA